MSKYPYMQFYTGDWLKDTKLAKCSANTKGVWTEALIAMHNDDRSGKLEGTVEEIAKVCRVTIKEMKIAIAELKDTNTANVTECNKIVTLINRRMFKEYKARVKSTKRVRKHRASNADVTPPVTVHISDTESESVTNTNTPLTPVGGIEGGEEKKFEIESEIMKHFGLTETNNFKQMVMIHEFCVTLNHRKRLDYFTDQFTAYRKFKELNKDRKGWYHNLGKFLGTGKEFFEDGNWTAEVWTQSLADFRKSNGTVATSGGGQVLLTKSIYEKR